MITFITYLTGSLTVIMPLNTKGLFQIDTITSALNKQEKQYVISRYHQFGRLYRSYFLS